MTDIVHTARLHSAIREAETTSFIDRGGRFREAIVLGANHIIGGITALAWRMSVGALALKLGVRAKAVWCFSSSVGLGSISGC